MHVIGYKLDAIEKTRAATTAARTCAGGVALALNLAFEVYRRVFRTRHLKAFIVNDPRTADARL
jgi:hypothetical protein